MKGEKLYITLAIIASIYGVYFVIRKLMKESEEGEAEDKAKALGDLKSDEPPVVSGGIATFTDNQYKIFANRLFIAMDGFGTDETEMRSVISEMRTARDMWKLDNAFGIRGGESLGSWIANEG